MAETSNRPLLTFSIGAYNQERFIRSAVEGAFVQTYSPLQIILSDDCSKDRTFEIMEQMASAYRGPHEVVLNRNPKNLGLVGHVNRLVQLMRGELIVMAAGDDISVPNRTELLYQAWEASQRKAFCIHSQVTNVDESFEPDGTLKNAEIPGKPGLFQDGPSHIKSYLRSNGPVVLGCTAAYSRTLFDRFGLLPPELVFEDMALTFRSLLSGGLSFIDRPLVFYRLHSNNIHHSNHDEYVQTWADLLVDEEKKKTILKRKLSVAKSFRADLSKALDMALLEKPDHAVLSDELNSFEGANVWELDYRTASFFKRIALFLGRPTPQKVPPPGSERLVYRLMPRWCYYSMRILKNRLMGLTSRAR
jgi:glycosyltransferase involved in cell wall biosynthesis